MLKIKSNTNEFTIIFSEKIGKKINAEKFSVPALSFFQLQRRTFFFFCFSPLLVSAVFFFFFSVQHHFPCFFRRVALFFQPKTILSSAQNVFFSPKPFSVQPPPLFQPLFVLFQPFFLFVGSVFNAPFLFVQRLLFFFLFQHLILFFLPTSKAKNILFRCFTFLLFE